MTKKKRSGLDSHHSVQVIPADFVYVHHTSGWDFLGGREIFDLVVHALVIQNNSKKITRLDLITLTAVRKEKNVQIIIYSDDDLVQMINPVQERLNLGMRRVIDEILGTESILPQGVELSTNLSLDPGKSLLIPNLYLSCPVLPEYLTIRATILGSGEEYHEEVQLSIKEHKSKMTYSLPVEGPWFTKAIPETGVLDHHRFARESEFGIDFIKLGPDGAVFLNQGDQTSDYFSHGEKVFAAADGEVVMLNNSAVQSRDRFFFRDGESEEEFQIRQIANLKEALKGDLTNWAAGNYLVIQHSPNEFSHYLHLKEDSIRVAVGEKVTRGQQVAEVGNTGDSFGAHLHFHLSSSPKNGRGLPVIFSNVEIGLPEPGYFIKPIREIAN